MSNGLLEKYNLKRYPYRINWEITRKCNFDCSYCVNKQGVNDPDTPAYPPKQIADFFDKTNKEWLILITGGEPFTYPKFAEVCQKLSQKHYLQITSNMSLPGIYDFANIVDPSKIFMISASYHSTERLSDKDRAEFLNKCKYLKTKGFPVVINYITHPDSMGQIEEDIKFFNTEGFETFAIILRGVVNGKTYPDSFSKKDWEIIKPYVLDFEIEQKAAFGELDFYGHKCEAGSKYFFMTPKGDISRCATLQKKIGNLFEDKFSFDKKERPCIVHNCNDVYCGLASVLPQKAGKFQINREKKLSQKP